MRCLVVIPAYNEADTIVAVIESLAVVALELDILVVSDGSSDETVNLVRAGGRAVVIDLACNLGIGGAVQAGFIYALQHNYDTVIKFDGDGQHLAEEVAGLLEVLSEDGVDVVVGSRFLVSGGFRSTFTRRLGIRLLEIVNSFFLGRRLRDNTSGFRAYNRRAIKFLAENYPAIDYPEPEEVVLLVRNGFNIVETAVAMAPRQGGRSSISPGRSFHYMAKVLLAIFMTQIRPPVK